MSKETQKETLKDSNSGSAQDSTAQSLNTNERNQTSASEDVVSEHPVEDGQVDSADTLTFSDEVIEKIVGAAARKAKGVANLKGGFINRVQETFGAKKSKGVEVEVEEDGSVALYISIVMVFGFYAPDVFEDVKQHVLADLSSMTGLPVSSVNLRIEDIALDKEDEKTAS